MILATKWLEAGSDHNGRLPSLKQSSRSAATSCQSDQSKILICCAAEAAVNVNTPDRGPFVSSDTEETICRTFPFPTEFFR
jgi:hypothetical protein